MGEDKAKELVKEIEDELTNKFLKYRYHHLSDGIAMSLDIVKDIAKKYDIDIESDEDEVDE